ncbi:hypothetical protein ACFSS8_12075 [Paracoccus kondratievae]
MIKIRQLALVAGTAVTLVACGPQGGLDFSNFDPDLRGWGGGGWTPPARPRARSPDRPRISAG